ncbi:hypothetical protein [Streptomyces lacrimifluminis]|nr:hypothetical protein [Streptomyces lacrimifluminis]
MQHFQDGSRITDLYEHQARGLFEPTETARLVLDLLDADRDATHD